MGYVVGIFAIPILFIVIIYFALRDVSNKVNDAAYTIKENQRYGERSKKREEFMSKVIDRDLEYKIKEDIKRDRAAVVDRARKVCNCMPDTFEERLVQVLMAEQGKLPYLAASCGINPHLVFQPVRADYEKKFDTCLKYAHWVSNRLREHGVMVRILYKVHDAHYSYLYYALDDAEGLNCDGVYEFEPCIIDTIRMGRGNNFYK